MIIEWNWIRYLGIGGITVWPLVIIRPDRRARLPHEMKHFEQQGRWFKYGLGVGLLVWHLLYLFALPVLWNPFRRKWEREAYAAEGINEEEADKRLRGWPYLLRW
jgi:hypothetical protein